MSDTLTALAYSFLVLAILTGTVAVAAIVYVLRTSHAAPVAVVRIPRSADADLHRAA